MLNNVVTSKAFSNEMSRFLESDTIDRTLKKEGFSTYLVNSLSQLLNTVLTGLQK